MGPTHYSYTVIFQLPQLMWKDWKKARKISRNVFEFITFIGGWNISMHMISGSPFSFSFTFCDKKKRLEYYRSALLAAFSGTVIDFRNWSVTDECDTTINY